MAPYTEPYDTADYLDSDEMIAAYLAEALETEDARIIAKSLATVVRAKGGMAQMANATGISTEALTTALNDNDNPEFGTILKVVHALGGKLSYSAAA